MVYAVFLPLALCIASSRQKLFNSVEVLRVDAYEKKIEFSIVILFSTSAAHFAESNLNDDEMWMLKHELPIRYWDKTSEELHLIFASSTFLCLFRTN